LATKTKTALLKVAQRLQLRGITTLTKAALLRRIERAKEQKAANNKRKPPATADVVKRRAIRKHHAAPVRKHKPATEKPVAPAAAAEIAAHKFDMTPQPVRKPVAVEQLGELPEAYGTGRCFLAARDPNWLYAYWDLTGAQMAEYRQRAVDGRLVLRVFEQNHPAPIHEFTVHGDTRNWYIPVNKPAATFSAQLGYWLAGSRFVTVSQSREATTPSAVVSADTTARFATIPLEVPLPQLFELIRNQVRDGEKLAEALHRLQATGEPFPFKVGVELGPWTPEQAAKLEQVLGGEMLRRVPVGSAEISEWLRWRLQEQLGSAVTSGFSPGGASWSGGPGKGFWLAVNAEVIIYGATDPQAKVTLDGEPIQLNSDGTFQFHFSFEDGKYRLPLVAVSPAGDDRRTVELRFQRRTETTGEVGAVKSARPAIG
jgi:hypothetical protein